MTGAEWRVPGTAVLRLTTLRTLKARLTATEGHAAARSVLPLQLAIPRLTGVWPTVRSINMRDAPAPVRAGSYNTYRAHSVARGRSLRQDAMHHPAHCVWSNSLARTVGRRLNVCAVASTTVDVGVVHRPTQLLTKSFGELLPVLL